jgi:glc operon protein GlcG
MSKHSTIRTGLIAAATLLAFAAGGAMAASLDSLVIHGDAAKKIHEKFALSIDTAKKMAATCIGYAKDHNIAVSVAIMDPIGEMVYFERMDGQGRLNTSTAILKAKTALVTRASTHIVMNNVMQNTASEFRAGFFNGEFANKGGLPIIAEDQFLGAIGVGGSGLDEECAQAALEAVVGPQPPLVQNLPRPGRANGG